MSLNIRHMESLVAPTPGPKPTKSWIIDSEAESSGDLIFAR